MHRTSTVLPLIVLFLAGAAAQTPPEPKLVLSQDSWDFGTILHLDKPELKVTITNAGTADLRIAKVTTSCGCTVAQPEKFNLSPGETTAMKVIFNSRGKKGKTDAEVRIESNDKSNPLKVFRLEGNVKRVIEMDPDWGAVFRILSPDEVMSIPVRIVNTTDQPMHLRMGTYSSGKFTPELKEVRPGKEYTITITTKPPITDRMMSDTLDIATSLADEPRLEISTQVMMIDRIGFMPPAILVGNLPNDDLIRTVEIEYFGNDPAFRITKATCDEPKVNPRLSLPLPPQADRPGRKPYSIVTLTLNFPPDVTFPPNGLPIKIFTNDPEYPELRIYATRDINLYRDLTMRARAVSQRKATP